MNDTPTVSARLGGEVSAAAEAAGASAAAHDAHRMHRIAERLDALAVDAARGEDVEALRQAERVPRTSRSWGSPV